VTFGYGEQDRDCQNLKAAQKQQPFEASKASVSQPLGQAQGYSSRRAFMGSILDARLAGTMPARAATITSKAETLPKLK
jgi:hypothetical protein